MAAVVVPADGAWGRRRLVRVVEREVAMFEEYHTMYRDRHDMAGVEVRPQKGAPAKEHEVAAAKRGSQRSVRRSKVSGRHSTASEPLLLSSSPG